MFEGLRLAKKKIKNKNNLEISQKKNYRRNLVSVAKVPCYYEQRAQGG